MLDSITDQQSFMPDGGIAGVVESGGFTHKHFDFNGYWEKRGRKGGFAGLEPASISELVKMLDHILNDNNKKTVDHTA